MATIGLLSYSLPNGINLNKAGTKILIETNPINNSTIITKLTDNEDSMIDGEELGIMRKKQKFNPLHEPNTNLENQNIQNTGQPTTKKQKILNVQPLNNIINIQKSKGNMTIVSTGTLSAKSNPQVIKSKSCSDKKSPLPQAVARRNARERNRVKQVNNGFAALRQHIPDEVAEAFEAAGNGRGTAKKLSKVETLRMAVEYIRSLEKVLGFDYSNSTINYSKGDSSLASSDEDSINQSNISLLNDDSIVIKSEEYGSPGRSDFDESSLYDGDESAVFFANQQDQLPDVTTINGQQYLRIPGTNTYQLITAEVFENVENIPMNENFLNINLTNNSFLSYPIIQSLTSSSPEQISPNLIEQNAPAISPPLSTRDQTVQYHTITTTTANKSMQPIISPVLEHLNENQHLLTQLQMQEDQFKQQLLQERLQVKIEQPHQMLYDGNANSSSSPLNHDDVQGYLTTNNDLQLYDTNCSNGSTNCIGNNNHNNILKICNKIKLGNNIILSASGTAGLSEETMMEAIDWWETSHSGKTDTNSIIM